MDILDVKRHSFSIDKTIEMLYNYAIKKGR